MSETRPRRATIMVSLTALAAGAAIAGGATILSLPSGKSPQVPLSMGYDGANNARQTGSPPANSATALAAEPGSPAAGSTSPGTSSSAPGSSSAPPSSGSSEPSTPSSPAPPPSPTQPEAPAPPPQQPAGSPNAGLAGEVVALVNQARSQLVPQCGALSVDDRLTKAAQKHATDMSANDYFSHTSEDRRSFADRIKAEGYPRPGGENIAQGQRTAKQVMDSWMKSDGHRENILRCQFKTIGVGVDTDGFYWVQDFGF